MDFSMSREKCQDFLAGLHVGVLSVAAGGRGPLTMPVWYAYEPGGDLWLVTDKDSRKAQLIRRAGRFSLCAQDEAPPYKYVSVEGSVIAIIPVDDERHVRSMARRYLGIKHGDQYTEDILKATDRREEVAIYMHPERWSSADYSQSS